jgi:carbamoyl-phosphate synthase large subunit
MKHILITSISSKVPFLNSVIDARDKFDPSISIFGADANKNVIGKYFVDFFWEMPKLSKISIYEILDYCLKNNIKYVIPSRDDDVIFLSRYKSFLLEKNIYIFVSEYESTKFCFDKLSFFEDSLEFKQYIIPTYKNPNMLDDNIVVKERYGAGSMNIGLNLSKQKALSLLNKFEEPVFQPFINGEELSIDSYLTKEGKYVSSIIRKRDLIIEGEAKITTRVFDQTLERIVKDFLEAHQVLGHSVLQVIKQKDHYHFIECNARFGGASTLSIELGLDSFYWFLLEANNMNIKVDISNKKLRQIRINKDIYIES